MKLRILIGKIKRQGSKDWKPLKLGDAIGEHDTVERQQRFGLDVIRCKATLSEKEAGRQRTKTWIIRCDQQMANAGEEIRKACEAQANRWKEKILAELLGEDEMPKQPKEVDLIERSAEELLA